MGYEPYVSEVDDIDALATAFLAVDGAYLLNPPAYHHANLFARAQTVHSALLAAVQRAGLQNVVALSSVGGQVASGTGNIMTTHDFEMRIRNSGQPIKVLRAANLMDNYAWSLRPVMDQGILPSMFLPLDRALPMVSSIDIGRTAAEMLMSGAVGPHLVELHGPRDYSPIDAANAFSAALGKVITAVEAPRQSWAGAFEKNGFSSVTVEAFCDMFDGFNNDVIRVDGSGTTQRGTVTLEQEIAD